MRARWVVLLLFSTVASADPADECHVVDVKFTPTADLQIVAWIEDTAGHYQDTAYITQSVGTYGLGNRPGRFDFNSGSPAFPSWPYGRRITTFPVWAHRHGMTFPEVDFQNGLDDDLSHPFNQSSVEQHYCRPLQTTDSAWDTGSCASSVFTDKGVLSTTKTSLYPPRQDVVRSPSNDSTSVTMYGTFGAFDAVSEATPPAGIPTTASWVAPKNLPPGNYVLFVEVSREFDMNDTYNPSTFPAPTGISFSEYGEPYRGQPSVVYSAPFTMGETTTQNDGASYIGYGDPDGLDGNVRAPDATITTGAERLQLVSDSGMYRIRVVHRIENDAVPPDAPGDDGATNVTGSSATVSFTAPGDDGEIGQVAGYEIRYRATTPMTEDNFLTAGSNPLPVPNPGPPGASQSIDLDKLLPETDYYVGIRAHDKCRNVGPLVVIKFHTADRTAGAVDACFVATAAYGSVLASDVGMLRHFRDAALKSSVLGELAIEAYYTFGPAAAGVIGESDLLRATTRAALAPVVAWVRTMQY
jgi:hypothetical protein